MIALLILILLTSCVKTEIICAPELMTKADTTDYACDSCGIDIGIDTSMVEVQHPIVFDAWVEDWEEDENDINI